MKLLLVAIAGATISSKAEIPAIPNSDSPDGEFYAVMDIDRDPKIDPEWKEDSYPQIEITNKKTRKVVASIAYFGSPGDDNRPLRDHVRLSWRPDSKAFALNIEDRFYSSCEVRALNKDSKFVPVEFPEYKTMTGFPRPNSDHLRPRGRSTVEGWDAKGRLIYYIFHSPLPSFQGNDPLEHRVFLKVTATGMVPEHIENKKGVWRRGDWLPSEKKESGKEKKAASSGGDTPTN